MVPLPFLPPELSLKSFLPPPSSFFAKAATRGEGKGGCPEEEEEEEKEVGAKNKGGEKGKVAVIERRRKQLQRREVEKPTPANCFLLRRKEVFLHFSNCLRLQGKHQLFHNHEHSRPLGARVRKLPLCLNLK